jgi:hypothetical protein
MKEFVVSLKTIGGSFAREGSSGLASVLSSGSLASLTIEG